MNSKQFDPYALAKVVAIIATNKDSNTATDVYGLADTLHEDLPSLSYEDLVELIERSIATIGGAAIWERRSKLN